MSAPTPWERAVAAPAALTAAEALLWARDESWPDQVARLEAAGDHEGALAVHLLAHAVGLGRRPPAELWEPARAAELVAWCDAAGITDAWRRAVRKLRAARAAVSP